MGISGVVLGVLLAQGGCTKDTDCKGDRVCEAGVCVNPPAPAAPPAASTSPAGPPPAPPPLPEPGEGPSRRPLASPSPPRANDSLERQPLPVPAKSPDSVENQYPRVVRREGLTCVQSLDAQGQVVESCRAPAVPQPRRDRRRNRASDDEAAEVPRGGFAFDLTARGGFMAALAGSSTFALPAFSATLGLGGVGANGVGAMGLLNLDIGTTRGFTGLAATLAPALRLGRLSHVSLGAGPSILAFSSTVGGGSGVVFSALVQGVIQLYSAFSLALTGSMHFDGSGTLFFLGVGFGASTPS